MSEQYTLLYTMPDRQLLASTRQLLSLMQPKRPSVVRQKTAEEVALAEADDLVALPARAYALVINAPGNRTCKVSSPADEYSAHLLW